MAATREQVFAAISAERQRQHEKWGVQRHDHAIWNVIFGEERGEVEQAIVEHIFAPRLGFEEQVITELIHTLAVGTAWLEQYYTPKIQ